MEHKHADLMIAYANNTDLEKENVSWRTDWKEYDIPNELNRGK